MARVQIDWDEWYPVYEIGSGLTYARNEIDLPDELVHRYETARAEFEAVQSLIHDAWTAQRGPARVSVITGSVDDAGTTNRINP